MKRGYYTIDTSDLYWQFVPNYKNGTYVKCKVVLFYKKGSMKGIIVDSKNYKLYLDKIQHWEKYDNSRRD